MIRKNVDSYPQAYPQAYPQKKSNPKNRVAFH